MDDNYNILTFGQFTLTSQWLKALCGAILVYKMSHCGKNI